VTSKFDYCLAKLAEEVATAPTAEPVKPNPWVQSAKIMGTGLAGFGLGHLVGAVGGKGIGHIAQRLGVDEAMLADKALPLATAAGGMLYATWRAKEQQAIRDAFENSRNQERIPGQ
jgi:hypothetical protein